MDDEMQALPGLVGFSIDDFKESDFNSIVEGFKGVRLFDISRLLAGELGRYQADSSSWRVVKFFQEICAVQIDLSKPDVYSPRMFTSDEGRTVIPGDVPEQQIKVIAAVLEAVPCSLLRAYLADIVWLSGCRDNYRLSDIACEAFCQVIQKYESGDLYDEFVSDDFVSNAIVDCLERSFQIMARIGRKATIPDFIINAWGRVMQLAITRSHAPAFVRVCSLGLNYGLIDHKEAGCRAVDLAGGLAGGYPMAAKRVWELAAYCYKRDRDDEKRLLCQLEAVYQTLKMRDGVTQAVSKASWTRDAIQELRQIGGQKEKIRELWMELLDFQEAALDEMTGWSTPVDLEEQIRITENAFSGSDLSSKLKLFAVITKVQDADQLKATALEYARNDPLIAMMGITRLDTQGKVITQVAGVGFEGAPSEDWYKHQVAQLLDREYFNVVRGGIYPALDAISNECPIYDKYLYVIADHSPFVPVGFKENYTKGFWMMFQGDFVGAAYVLIPMLENSLRYILSLNNQDSSKMDKDSIQEDRSLKGLLEARRAELEHILGANNVYAIDLLFHHKGGPSLRHEVAHGKLSSGGCHHYPSVYGCWLIYRLACLPLYNHWDEIITPSLAALK